MANAVTPNMGIELPTPGVTGALGVEPPGESWLELLNTGLQKVDVHDHGDNGGVPVASSALDVDADLSFNGFNLIDLRTIRFLDAGGALVGANDKLCAYFVGTDFYINNGSGVAVRVTNGANVAGAAGNITGLSGTAALSYSSGTGIFTFESATGIKAGVYMGPLSVFEPIAGGKKVTIAVPAGLAADYALKLPAALPASKLFMMLDASGVITAEASAITSVDGVSITSVGGQISVMDLGIVTGKLADLAVTTGKLADAAVTRPKLAAVGEAVSSSSGSATPISATSSPGTDVTNLQVRVPAATGRPIQIQLLADGSANPSMVRSGTAHVDDQYSYLVLSRSPHGAGTWTVIATQSLMAPAVGVAASPPSAFAFTDRGASAGDWDYKISAFVSEASTYCEVFYAVLYAAEL